MDSLFVPRVAGSGLQPEPIEGSSDLLVSMSNRHLPDHFNRFQARATSMLTCEIFLHAVRNTGRQPSESTVRSRDLSRLHP